MKTKLKKVILLEIMFLFMTIIYPTRSMGAMHSQMEILSPKENIKVSLELKTEVDMLTKLTILLRFKWSSLISYSSTRRDDQDSPADYSLIN